MTSAADRQRLRRGRKRSGLCVLRVEVDLGEVAATLVDVGFLAEWDAEDRKAVAAAVSRLMRSLTEVDPVMFDRLKRHA